MALADPRPRPASLRDLDELPDHLVGHVVDGELIVHPRPEGPHVIAASELGYRLVGPFRHGFGGPGGWVILHEPLLLLGEQLVIPDLAGWRRERFVRPRKGPFAVAPDWVCEILSPSTRRFDRSVKLPLFARAGIAHAWILDPEAETLEVLRLHDGRWLIVAVHEGPSKVRAEPFDAVELDLSLVWGDGPEGPTVDEADAPP